MQLDIKGHEPLRMAPPFADEYTQRYRRNLKQLGISPTVDNGIRAWRVIWRPFLPQPVPYQKPNGAWSLKYKANNVCTERFPIVGDTTEWQAFQQAALTAAAAYRRPVAKVMPQVNWQILAAAQGVKLREAYAKPALNGGRERMQALLEKGYGLERMARELGISKATACRWRQHLQKENAPQQAGR